MKVLAILNIDDTIYRIADGNYSLKHKWTLGIFNFRSFCLELSYDWGGMITPRYSDITITPKILLTDTASIKIMILDGEDESDAITIFDGAIHPDQISNTGTECTLYEPDIDVDIADETIFNDTLTNCLTSICDEIGLTLDTSFARAETPTIKKTLTSDTSALKLIKEMCAWCCHAAQKVDDTLYIYDLLSTDDIVTELKIYRSKITSAYFGGIEPYASFEADDYTVEGLKSFGDDKSITEYHDTEEEIIARLTDIALLAQLRPSSISLALIEACPKMLQVVKFIDDTLEYTLGVKGRIIDLTYDFNSQAATIEYMGNLV